MAHRQGNNQAGRGRGNAGNVAGGAGPANQGGAPANAAGRGGAQAGDVPQAPGGPAPAVGAGGVGRGVAVGEEEGGAAAGVRARGRGRAVGGFALRAGVLERARGMFRNANVAEADVPAAEGAAAPTGPMNRAEARAFFENVVQQPVRFTVSNEVTLNLTRLCAEWGSLEVPNAIPFQAMLIAATIINRSPIILSNSTPPMLCVELTDTVINEAFAGRAGEVGAAVPRAASRANARTFIGNPEITVAAVAPLPRPVGSTTSRIIYLDQIAGLESIPVVKHMRDLASSITSARGWLLDLVACNQIKELKGEHFKSYFASKGLRNVITANIDMLVNAISNHMDKVVEDPLLRVHLSDSKFIEYHTSYCSTPSLIMRAVEALGEYADIVFGADIIDFVEICKLLRWNSELSYEIPTRTIAITHAFVVAAKLDVDDWKQGEKAKDIYPAVRYAQAVAFFKRFIQLRSRVNEIAEANDVEALLREFADTI